MKTKAIAFGTALDQDDYKTARSLLADKCIYDIGSECLHGPEAICNSYEQNMIEGKKKLDSLEWGKCKIEAISEQEYFVHFTDYLRHQGVDYVHRCKQKLTFNEEDLIIKIEHIHKQDEQDKLNAYYKSVGILK